MTSRRDVLKLGGLAGGGLLLGLQLPGCWLRPGPTAIERHFAATGEFRPSAWLRITPDDRIVFTLDRVEMGQGTMTSHTTLVAEELEVEPARIEVVFAEASRAYDNPDPDLRFQITGGSTSLKTSWEPLRRAGAVAREMLRRAAAGTWQVALAECVAKDGAVHHAASGRTARYGELAGAAAALDVPEVALKDPKDFRSIGRSIDRLDARMKVDGTGQFGIDVRVPDMLTAVLVRPAVRGARAVQLDATAARRSPGVVDVFAIDEGVAVVAHTYWQARRAAEDVRVEWAGGFMAAVSTEEIRATYARLAARPGKAVRDDGDAGRALGRAARTLDATYELPYLAHATMEPMNATAHVTRDRCEIWAPTQSPGVARWLAAKLLGLDQQDVVVHTTLLGGGFGRRIPQDYVLEAVKVAHKVGRPVKVVWSREDDLTNDFYRPMALSALRGGVDAAGRPSAWLHRLVTQSIVSQVAKDFVGALLPTGVPRPLLSWSAESMPRNLTRGTVVDTTSIEGAADLPYAIPDLRVEYHVADTPVPVGFWRSVGHSHNAFVTEGFLDELAHLGGQDPVALRRALLRGHPRHLQVLEVAAAKGGWGTPLPAGHGRGVAVHASFGSWCAQVVEVEVAGREVRVRRVVAALDCGRVVNPGLVVAQIESGIVFGLSAALKQQVTITGGVVQQTNFHDFPLLRYHECPAIEVHLIESGEAPTGVGEPGVPPIAPALCGAIFAATGRRIRRLPVELALAEAS